MKKMQSGFTLIELVMVIVILGILAASALPKFVDLKGDASDAAAKGLLGSFRSAAVIGHAQQLISSGVGVIDTVAKLQSAVDIGGISCTSADPTFVCDTSYSYTLGAATTTTPATITVSGHSDW